MRVCRLFTHANVPVYRSLPCCRDVGGSVRDSAPAAGRSGRSRGWAAIRRSPAGSLCCCFSRDAGCEMRGTKVSDMRSMLGFLRGWKKCCILHFELLVVALGQNTCVGEREPAAPADNKGYRFCGRCSFPAGGSKGALHLVLFVLSIVPAVTGFRHEQGDDVSLGEAQQCAVVACSVGEDGLDAGAAVLLQPCSHGTGPGQGPCLP